MTTTLENPLFDRDVVTTRSAQQKNETRLPTDLTIVSTDGHWEVSEDIFYENFPAHLKKKAPRVWFDDFWRQGDPKPPVDSQSQVIDMAMRKFIPNALGSGAWDIDVRNRDLAIEGVHKEILYPQSLLAFIRLPDHEVQEQIYWIYNEYMARISAIHPGRYYGVGVCSNWWDPTRAWQAVKQIRDLGLKTFMLPTSNVGKNADGSPLSYAAPEMDTLWDEIARAGLPVSFHIGENIGVLGRGGFGASALQSFCAARKPLGELIFGGVFDRHPDLRVVFVEFGIAWIPVALQEAEQLYDHQGPLLEGLNSLPKRRPSYYWHNNCYATFQNDLLGLKLLDYIGADRVMWAQDYPHNEGTFGYSWSSRECVYRATTLENARKILGETAMELYHL
ncbi:MAG TPA: amidohydrolase family protein [Candidatus Binataceae bacterium]|jgi:predicted TIM-barrel fold metal-dependent hydrolase